ncbi:MAG: glycine zipper family protein [Gammaproteobacteria bacterium]
MSNTSHAVLSVSLLVLSGCASYGTWTPTVDPYGDANANRITADTAECQHLAKQASGGTANETLKGTVVGGLFGAAAGAAIGAAVGDPAAGAALGAAAGGMSGAAHNGYNAEDQYKRAYTSCLRNRGHNVVN